MWRVSTGDFHAFSQIRAKKNVILAKRGPKTGAATRARWFGAATRCANLTSRLARIWLSVGDFAKDNLTETVLIKRRAAETTWVA